MTRHSRREEIWYCAFQQIAGQVECLSEYAGLIPLAHAVMNGEDHKGSLSERVSDERVFKFIRASKTSPSARVVSHAKSSTKVARSSRMDVERRRSCMLRLMSSNDREWSVLFVMAA